MSWNQSIQGDLTLILLLTGSLTSIFFKLKVLWGGGGVNCYKLQCKILQSVHDLPVYTITVLDSAWSHLLLLFCKTQT